MAPSPKTEPLETVIVLGGCGYFGYHLIAALLQETTCKKIVALSRNPTVNRHENVLYRACNITSSKALNAILEEFQPRVIFHAAAPRANDKIAGAEFFHTNVGGTKAVIDCAVRCPSLLALVYTSTCNVYDGHEHLDLDEEAPLCVEGSSIPYNVSKAQADGLVRKANSTNLKTVALRMCLIVGERDNAFVPGLIDAPTIAQMGDNTNTFDTVSAVNGAAAHILAAKALLDPTSANEVSGQAFNITDGNPTHFWDLSRMLWKAAGRRTDRYLVLPSWAAFALAEVTELLFLIFTFGTKKPQAFNKLVVLYCVLSHTYNISKAKRVLRYEPKVDLEGVIQRSVNWHVKNRKGKFKSA